MDFDYEKPDPRFQNFEEVFNSDGIAIGFTLPENTFVFCYDAKGGWKDQHGNQFNAKGILVKPKEEEEDEEQQDDDEEILDQFEQMLVEDQHGVVKKKNKEKQKKVDSIDQETTNLLKQFEMMGDRVRKGIPKDIPLYFKSKAYKRIKPDVENGQNVGQRNQKVQKIKKQVQQQKQQLKQRNKWLAQAKIFDFSGTILDENIYERYWYGVVWASCSTYLHLRQQISKSQEFGLLAQKSYYALKSKFYLKQKMVKTIEEEKKHIEQLQSSLVQVSINNLPENFPSSYVVELFDYVGLSFEVAERLELVDEETAQVTVTKDAAFDLLNLEGYCHDDKSFVWLEFSKGEGQKSKSQFYNVATDSPYKPHFRELMDTMAFEQNKTELVKVYTEEEEQKVKFRFVIGKGALRRLLMFRGNTINIDIVQAYKK